MEMLITFAIAFFFSFVGTLPPGTLSLTIVQLGLNNRIDVAWRMAIAAAIVEYPYAWVAVEFQEIITGSLNITHDFHLVASLVMLTLGTFNLWSSVRPTRLSRRFEDSGFRKGILLSILNPLAIPFWIAMTAYIKNQGWISLSDNLELHAYLLGVSTGTFVVFMLLAHLARRVVSAFKTAAFLRQLPGVLLILLGTYSLGEYIFG